MNTKVKDLLPKLKANRTTFYNLDLESKLMFKKSYDFLLKKKNYDVSSIVVRKVKDILSNKRELDYLRKLKAMQVIERSIFLSDKKPESLEERLTKLELLILK